MKKRILSIFLMLALVLNTITPIPVFAEETAQETDGTGKNSSRYIGDGYEVAFDIVSQWEDAFNAEATITNTGEEDIENWALQFNMPYEITNIWNGTVYSHENPTYLIKNAGFNQRITKGQSVSFGFTANATGTVTVPDSYELAVKEESADTSSTGYSFELTSISGTSFYGEIKITNLSENAIEGWKLEFDFDGEIERFWEAEILEHSGSHYIIRSAGHNYSIGANETLTLGFNGTLEQEEVQPSNYQLSQIVINDTKYVTLEDGKIEKDYLTIIQQYLFRNGQSIENVKLADDYDGDGLTLQEEYEYDTSPFLADTDEDGLNDWDEVHTYNTDPNHPDTDSDSMSDGTEISAGLNPLKADSDENGIPDSEETVTQQVRLNSVESYELEDVGTLPSVTLTGKGDYSQQLYATSIENDAAVLEIDCLVGTAFDFVHEEELDFESGELSFAISDTVLKDNKLEDLAVAWYDESNNVLQLLDTAYDESSKTITAPVEHFSTYMVVSVPDYFFYNDWENESSTIECGKADIVFVIDTTGSMSSPISNVRSNINSFVTKLAEDKVDVRLGLVEYKDIYADGADTTKSYDWCTSVSDFKTKLGTLGISGGGDTPESAVDALYCAGNMKFRSGAKKYIILVTDADYKDGISTDSSFTMEDEISSLVSNDIVTSVVTRAGYFSDYSSLVSQTDGVTANIKNSFSTELESIISKIGKDVNSGCWVRLSNGSVVCLDKDPALEDDSVDTDGDGVPDVIELKTSCQVSAYNPYTKEYQLINTWTFDSNPAKADTDGDTLSDADDLNPSKYDTVILSNTDDEIKFNTGRTWHNISCTSFDYLDNFFQFLDNSVNNPIPLDTFAKIVDKERRNEAQNFTIDELTVIGLLNNEGSKLYMDDETDYVKEYVFKTLAGRSSKNYKHSGILWWENWKEVSKDTKGGFFKGTVLTEADINFSTDIYKVCDVFTVLNTVVKAGAVVIAVIVAVDAAPVVLAHIEGIAYYCGMFGVVKGLQMYTYLGIHNLPNGVITWIQMDAADGDSCLDDLVDKGIPVYERGKTGEEELAKSVTDGVCQKYFTTYVDGKKYGRFVDCYDATNKVAHESKVGYTCLDKRIRLQALKDSYLLTNGIVEKVEWHFYRSEITGKIGASKPLLEFLEENNISYIIEK